MNKLDKADKASTSRAVAGTLGAALGAIFMVGAITFGATAIRPMTAGPAAQDQTARADRADRAGHGGRDVAQPDRTGDDAHKEFDANKDDSTGWHDPKDHPKAQPREEPKDEPAEEPKEAPAVEPKDEPKEEPKDEPKPAPVNPNMELGAMVKEGKVKLGWSKFRGDGFAYYKVVRSTDGQATWPTSGDDQLVGAISDRYTTYMQDNAPCGTEFHYRVFAVKSSASGYQVLAASNVAGAFVECHEPTPPPEPHVMAFQVVQTAEGVQLSWEQCTSDGFVYYKVVRSATNPDPRYPLNDGTELLAAIGDSAVTTFTDAGVAPGETWFYRVLSLADNGDGWVVVGLTNALSITVA